MSYLVQGFRVGPVEVYTSNIELNQEHGQIEVPHVPVVRTATPVFAGERKIGLVVLNVDLRVTLAGLRREVPDGNEVYTVALRSERARVSYVTKPVGFEEYQRAIRAVEEFWTGAVKLPPPLIESSRN
ncbi:MAG: hypothetical protein KC766_25560 [Myxococcales bacterium]|nr:hypothetical protein [Myxococcales bacterium]